MNAQEALLLCRYAKAASPSQHMDEYTPDAWLDLLEDLRYVDAQEALRNHLRREQYVAPSDIRKGVAALRLKRREDHGIPQVPHDLWQQWQTEAEAMTNGPEKWRHADIQHSRWAKDVDQRIMDGETFPELVSRALSGKPEGW